MKTKINILHKIKRSFGKILTEKYIPRNISTKKDELGCIKLPKGSLICPVDYKSVKNNKGNWVTAIKYSDIKEMYSGRYAKINNRAKKAMIYLIIINVQKHIYIRNKMFEGDMSEIELNTDDFIDTLSDGCAYFCYRHALTECNEDINYQLISLKAWAEGEIRIALADIIRYKYKASKDPDLKDMFVNKGMSIYTCLNKSLNSDERRCLANKSRRLSRIKILSTIIFSAGKRNIHKIYKKTKKGAKLNIGYIMDRLNSKLDKVGMKNVRKSTIYNYLKIIINMCGKTISDLYDEAVSKGRIVPFRSKKGVVVGGMYLRYHGSWMRITIDYHCIEELIL